jgi:hypothetical protein
MLQLKKDVRRHWLLLASWGLILAIQPILNIIPFSNVISNQIGAIFSTLVVSVQSLLLLVMIPLLVHDEPLVDSTAFWLTRPLSAGTILLTKTLFIALLIVLPALAAEIMFIANGYSFRQILPGVPEIIIEKLALVVPLVIIASLTRNFAIYAVVCVITVVASYFILPLLGWILSMFFMPLVFSSFSHLNPTSGLMMSRKVVADIVLILIGSFIVYCQYITRNTRRSIVYSIVLIIILLLVKWFWSLDVLDYYKSPAFVKKEMPSTDSISIAAGGLHKKSFESSAFYKINEIYLNAYLEILNTPSGYAVEIKEVKSAKIVFPDLTVSGNNITGVMMRQTNPEIIFAPPDMDVEALQSVLNNAKVLNSKKKLQLCTLISLKDDDFNKCAGKTGVYSADLLFSTFKYKIIAELPLEKGASRTNGNKRTTLMGMKQVDGGCEIFLSSKKINFVFAANPDREKTYLEKMTDSINFFKAGGNFVLYNSQDNSICVPSRMMPNPFDFVLNLYGLSGRIENHACELVFKTPTEEWLRNAKLVILDTEQTGEITKPLRIENLSMADFADENRKK